MWWRSRAGQQRLYCSSACSQAAYRARIAAAKDQEDARKERERQQRRERARRARQERAEGEQRYRERASAGGGSWTGGGGSSAAGWDTPLANARAVVFKLAGRDDDGGAKSLKRAYRRASLLLHPDQNNGVEPPAYRRLDEAAMLLKAAGLL